MMIRHLISLGSSHVLYTSDTRESDLLMACLSLVPKYNQELKHILFTVKEPFY